MVIQNNLVQASWRMNVDTFAQRISRGHWLPFPWIASVLQHIQIKIVRGGARIIINAPPQHGKSEGISHWLPTWFLDWFPSQRVILGSYSDTYAERWGVAVRDEFQNGKETWTRVRKDRGSGSSWDTIEGGGMKTAGVGGALTGFGGDLLILDDPVKNLEEATSPTFRKRNQDWFFSTLLTRAQPLASVIVIMTRWHELDLTGFLLKEQPGEWELIRLPAIAEENDFLGRQPGQALCPERFDEKALAQFKGIGSYLFNGLYQQRPAPPEGAMVKRDWFKRYSVLPDRIDAWVQSWDLTFGDTGSSYVVGSVWARSGGNFYAVDLNKDKLNFPDTLRAIQVMSNRWPQSVRKLVEKAANGAAVISILENKIPGIIGVPPKGSKENRLAAVSGAIESGNVYLPADAEWVEGFLDEVCTFPNSANDDQVDSMSMALDDLLGSAYYSNVITLPTAGSRPNPWGFINAGL